MKLPLEIRALGWAVLIAFLSLGSVWLAASPIHQMTATTGPATEPWDHTSIPVTPQLVQQGQGFFGMSCSQCHGDDAHGDEGPDLHNLTISDARITRTIQRGIKGEMPTFAKKYNDAQIAALVAYLRTLH